MYKEILVGLLLGLMSVVGVSVTVMYVKEDLMKYQNESLCVNHLIRKGYERRHIETRNGTCWIKSRIKSPE